MLVATNYWAQGVDNVDLSTAIGRTLVDNVDNLFLGGTVDNVDNVDNLFLNCPTCPQKTKDFWEKEKGRVKKQVICGQVGQCGQWVLSR